MTAASLHGHHPHPSFPRRARDLYNGVNDPLHPLVMRLRAHILIVLTGMTTLQKGIHSADPDSSDTNTRSAHLYALRSRWEWLEWVISYIPIHILAQWEDESLDIVTLGERIEATYGMHDPQWMTFLMALDEVANLPLPTTVMEAIDHRWAAATAAGPDSPASHPSPATLEGLTHRLELGQRLLAEIYRTPEHHYAMYQQIEAHHEALVNRLNAPPTEAPDAQE